MFGECRRALKLRREAELHEIVLRVLIDERLLTSAIDVSDGGIAVALAKSCYRKRTGVVVSLDLTAAKPLRLWNFLTRKRASLL